MAKDLNILATSSDARLLAFTLAEFAASDQAADQAVALRHLSSRAFLLRVNTEEDYFKQRSKTLRIAGVLKTLMDSPHAVAKPTLVALTTSADFLSFAALQELLVMALGSVRPSPPEAIHYWDSHSQPESANLHLVIEAIFINRSAPALTFFETKMADERQEIECRTIWLRDQMLRQRNDLEVLRSCERMVTQGTVPPPIPPLVVEALCDYHPDWYLACKKPKPPPRLLASDESKEVLRRICRFADGNLSLEPPIKAALEVTMREIGAGEGEGAQG
jgi:hypothetical protein